MDPASALGASTTFRTWRSSFLNASLDGGRTSAAAASSSGRAGSAVPHSCAATCASLEQPWSGRCRFCPRTRIDSPDLFLGARAQGPALNTIWMTLDDAERTT